MSYNGWKNYETWAVALWIDNDEATHDQRRAMAADVAGLSEDALRIPGTKVSRGRCCVLADRLKEWVRDGLAPDLGASLWSDLLMSALCEVDWEEIAVAWLLEVTP